MPAKAPSQKQKKKGRAPAHQNSFAFQHNPKSKKTAKILSSPVNNCCRRCREKLLWRKQYRKYKPLTQPSTCNQCHRKCITAAYHTICKQCSSDSDAFRRVKTAYPEARRACEVCAKAPVDERDLEDEDAKEQGTDVGRRLKLREIKTLERQRLRKMNGMANDQSDEEGDEEGQSDARVSHNFEGELEYDNLALSPQNCDPFLTAIGGKILTGRAYQEQFLSSSASNK